MNVGDNIRKYRKERGWTQKELGQRLGMSDSQLRNYELGFRSPSYKTLLKITNALHVQISDLDAKFAPVVQGRTEEGEKTCVNMEQKKTDLQQKNMEFILHTLKYNELLCQMAEEAAELAQAAMKYRRKMVKGNPTTVSWKKARENLLEEIADVMLLAELLLWDEPKAWEQVENTKEFKAKRWVGRLKGEENLEQE